MEIKNQNGINVTDERLAEMKEETVKNENILKNIQDERAALAQERAQFVTFSEGELQNINEARKELKKESDAIERQRVDLKNKSS